jgi:hypothetical protein
MTDARVHLTVNFPFNHTPKNAKTFKDEAKLIRRVLQWYFAVEGYMVMEIQCAPATHYRQRPNLHLVLNKALDEETVLEKLAFHLSWDTDGETSGKLVQIVTVTDLDGLAIYLSKTGQKTFAGSFATLKPSFKRIQARERPTRQPERMSVREINRTRRHRQD